MKLSEAARIAWEAILKNKIRSFLTMLGIIIGVAAVIIMVAISAGTEATIQEQITSLGTNLIFVQGAMTRGGPGQAPTGGLVFDDAAAIQDGVSGVTSVVVEQNSSETVKFGDVLLEDISIHGARAALINITTGQPAIRRDPATGQLVPKTTWAEALDERLAAPKEFSPEITSFNMGPMNAANWILADTE